MALYGVAFPWVGVLLPEPLACPLQGRGFFFGAALELDTVEP